MGEVSKETLQPGDSYAKSLLPFSGPNSLLGIAMDSQGSLYVADTLNNRVVKLTPSGSAYMKAL
jgi:hypothetical protein